MDDVLREQRLHVHVHVSRGGRAEGPSLTRFTIIMTQH